MQFTTRQLLILITVAAFMAGGAREFDSSEWVHYWGTET